MKRRVIGCFTAFLFLGMLNAHAQQSEPLKHRVNRGETVSKIARDYGVRVTEIFELNPDAKNGIRENDFLLIPNKQAVQPQKTTVPTQQNEVKTHTVAPKETLYGISRQYKVTVQDLYQWNPGLRENGLKAGEVLNLSEDKTITKIQEQLKQSAAQEQEKWVMRKKIPASTVESSKTMQGVKIVQVAPKETLYGLALEHNTTIQHLLELNPELKKTGLAAGQEIKVPSQEITAVVEEGISPDKKNTTTEPGYITIVIEPKQTIYSLTKEYGVSPRELLELNPDLRSGLKTGMKLKVPAPEGVKSTTRIEEKNDAKTSTHTSAAFIDLSKTIVKTQPKELVLILPFNKDKVEQNLESRLRNDTFLNMTLDFYAGALMAIEKADQMGLPLTVRVFDSKETKNSSDMAHLLSTEDFSKTDVIIGPFFQKNVDLAAQRLPNNHIKIVSPLSNEKLSIGSNVIQTMPHSDVLRSRLLDYFIKQEANITVVVDPKKTSTKTFMQRYYPSVRVVNADMAKSISSYLRPQAKNVFILDSNSIETALETTNQLKDKTEEYTIQLAAFEKNDVFDYGEIKIETLVDLKLIYPSVTLEDVSEASKTFAKEFKSKNNIYPSRYATRGYDVTYDMILRLFQSTEFEEALEYPSQQIENKFIYTKSSQGLVRNLGVYLLQYTDDLTIKQVQ